VQNFLKIGSGVPELVDPEKWHFPLKPFIALTTVLRYHADCDSLLWGSTVGYPSDSLASIFPFLL